MSFDTPGFEYERVVRYNYDQKELNVLIDVVSLIKSLAGVMLRAEHILAPALRLTIYADVQKFVQAHLRCDPQLPPPTFLENFCYRHVLRV